MNNRLYLKLACTNIKNNRKFYFPYLLSALFTVITFFTISTLRNSESLDNLYGGTTLRQVLMLGSIIIGIFAVIFLFYTNGFMIKQRKKELGLYCILGLEKKHMARVLTYETLLTILFVIGGGLVAGTILSQLIFLVLLNLVHFDITLKLQYTVRAYLTTVLLFLAIFSVTLLKNYFQVHLTNPINLLKGSNQGEKEPKASIVLAILGIALLGSGYYMAVTIQNPIVAMMYFFVAVILVILGTHLIFTSSSVFLLKFLKKRKSFYYKPRNFISISGMIYRMKQNAAGLANICILSTMVIVCILSTFALYMGQKDMMADMYPRDIQICEKNVGSNQSQVDQIIDQVLSQYDIDVTFQGSYRHLDSYNLQNGNQISEQSGQIDSMTDMEHSVGIELISLDELNQFVGGNYQIDSENQVLLFDNKGTFSYNTIQYGDQTLEVKERLTDFNHIRINYDTMNRMIYLVVKDYNTMLEIYRMYHGYENIEECEASMKRYYYLDVDGEKDTCVAFEKKLREEIRKTEGDFQIRMSHVDNLDWYTTYGGMLFVGAYFGVLFLMATVLIIYYKQITEGYDDHERFDIMQKVGMSRQEVKKTIHKQILMVFILPVALAACHTCFALPMLKKIFLLFGLYNNHLVHMCTLGTVVVYMIVYGIVYSATAKVYYRIVE